MIHLNWVAFGAIATAGSVFIGILARYIQEDLKRTRLRYYLRSRKTSDPERHAAVLTVVNVGRSSAYDILCYLSPGCDDCSDPPREVEGQIETDEQSYSKSEGHALIVRVPVLHPSDRFRVLLSWKGGVTEYTRKHRECFRISYAFGTSNKYLRFFGRVHRFWWWQRRRDDKKDCSSLPSLHSSQIAKQTNVSISVSTRSH